MLDKFAAFLGTTWGFWFTMGLTALCCVVALWWTDLATFALSVIAIVLAAILIVAGSHDRRLDLERDKAMHKKLDGLIKGVDKADDNLQGIEPEEK